MDRVCAFFGHREVWKDISVQLEQAIRLAIENYHITTFWVGGYGQFDAQAAGCVRRLRKEFPDVRLQLIVAYLPGRMDAITDSYDGIIYPEGLELVPRRFAISKRNQWMVRHCDLVITYVNQTYGGAYQAYQMAKGKMEIINLGEICENKKGW